MLRRLVLLVALSAQAPGAAASAVGQSPSLVVLGDSLVAGYGLTTEQAFPAVLQQDLAKDGFNIKVMNAGVSGDTAEEGLARVDWSVPSDATAVLVELGANDMLRGIDPKVTKRSLFRLVRKLQARRLRVMLAGMYASPTLGRDYAAEFDRIYPDLAAALHVPLYPFFLQGVADNSALLQKDGMHPTAAGVKAIAAALLPKIEAFLGLNPADATHHRQAIE